MELEFPTLIALGLGITFRKIDAMVDETYYSLLGVPNAATDEQITAAYRDLLKKIHPDTVALLSPDLKREAAEVTREIIEAYSVLSDPSRRVQYDRELSQHRQHSPPPPTNPIRSPYERDATGPISFREQKADYTFRFRRPEDGVTDSTLGPSGQALVAVLTLGLYGVIPIGIILAEAGDVAAAIAEILFITLMSLVAYAIRHSPKSRGWFRGIVIAIAWHTFWLCVFAALRWLL